MEDVFSSADNSVPLDISDLFAAIGEGEMKLRWMSQDLRAAREKIAELEEQIAKKQV